MSGERLDQWVSGYTIPASLRTGDWANESVAIGGELRIQRVSRGFPIFPIGERWEATFVPRTLGLMSQHRSLGDKYVSAQAALDAASDAGVTLLPSSWGAGTGSSERGTQRQRCTGLTASWCPVHGTCSCVDVDGISSKDERHCPLHDVVSDHPLPW